MELRETLRTEFKVGKTLNERLTDAIANEQYEEAAKLRDEMRRRGTIPRREALSEDDPH